jgi:hypothetical protein
VTVSTTTTNVTKLALADINADGKLDILTVSSLDGTVAVLLNTTAAGSATPAFATAAVFSAGTNLTAIATADLNGDGKPDVAVAGPTGLSVLLNTTAAAATMPSFATALHVLPPPTDNPATIAVVTGTPSTEIAALNVSAGSLSVFVDVGDRAR